MTATGLYEQIKNDCGYLKLDRRQGLALSSLPLLPWWRVNHRRHKLRGRFLAQLPGLAAPAEQLLWRQTVTPCDHRHDRSRLQCLRQDPGLVVCRPMTPTTGPGDDLDPLDLTLRLKRRFKSRHKPIPNLDTGSLPLQITTYP